MWIDMNWLGMDPCVNKPRVKKKSNCWRSQMMGRKSMFETLTLPVFWIKVMAEHPELATRALQTMLPFPTPYVYLCEAGFLQPQQPERVRGQRGCYSLSVVGACQEDVANKATVKLLHPVIIITLSSPWVKKCCWRSVRWLRTNRTLNISRRSCCSYGHAQTHICIHTFPILHFSYTANRYHAVVRKMKLHTSLILWRLISKFKQ